MNLHRFYTQLTSLVFPARQDAYVSAPRRGFRSLLMPLIVCGLMVGIAPTLLHGQFVISEFMADNVGTLADEDGKFSDWIEIQHRGDTPASLLGWSLTDSTNRPAKWRFPDVVVGPGQFVLIFASGNDRTNATRPLHTNFRLAAEGEFLSLNTPSGAPATQFEPQFPVQRPDLSYGLAATENAEKGFFLAPTPGRTNASLAPGDAGEVIFSHPGGVYTEPFQLVLSNALASEIRFTRDGSAPTTNSPRYTSSLVISNSVEVRARAFAPGVLPGPIRSAGFVRLSPEAAQRQTFTSSLPILVLARFNRLISTEIGADPIPAHFFLHEPKAGAASLTQTPDWQTRGAIKVRGNSTRGLPSPSYSIQWKDEQDEDVAKPILDLPADAEWALVGPGVLEGYLLNNVLIHRLARETGTYSPRTRYVDVYLAGTGAVTSNDWRGIYILMEKISVGPHRVAIDRLSGGDLQAPEVTGGYLMKSGGGFNPESFPLLPLGQVLLDPTTQDLELPGRRPQFDFLVNFYRQMEDSLQRTNANDPVRGFRNFIDVENWVDYHLREFLSGNKDAFINSDHRHLPRNGKLRYGPHWDYDQAFGTFPATRARAWNASGTEGLFLSEWMGDLLSYIDVWQLWIDRWQLFRTGPLSVANVNRMIDEQAAELRPFIPRWRSLGSAEVSLAAFDQATSGLKDWLSNRMDFADSQMATPPRLGLPAGRVALGSQITLTADAGAGIYYTLDGSDPRRSGATNSPATNAILYSGPITVNGQIQLVVRALDLSKRQTSGPRTSSPWSGPTRFSVELQPRLSWEWRSRTQLRLSWDRRWTTVRLETTDRLTPPNWRVSIEPTTTQGGRTFVDVPIGPASDVFFRLRDGSTATPGE